MVILDPRLLISGPRTLFSVGRDTKWKGEVRILCDCWDHAEEGKRTRDWFCYSFIYVNTHSLAHSLILSWSSLVYNERNLVFPFGDVFLC